MKRKPCRHGAAMHGVGGLSAIGSAMKRRNKRVSGRVRPAMISSLGQVWSALSLFEGFDPVSFEIQE